MFNYLRMIDDKREAIERASFLPDPKAFLALSLDAMLHFVAQMSQHYKTPASSMIFVLNNANYLLQAQGLQDADTKTIELQIQDTIKTFLTAWKSLVRTLSPDPTMAPKTHNLPSRDKLKLFSAAFDEITNEQAKLVIPDGHLRDSLRAQIVETMLPPLRRSST